MLKERMTRSSSALAGLVALVALACGGGSWVRVQYGEVATEGVVIEEEHGMFRWTAGTLIDAMPSQATTLSIRAAVGDAGRAAALADLGAPGIFRVRVSHPNYPDPFYGVLQLHQAHSSWRGPGTRSFQFLVPEDRLASATDGRTAVVFERVTGQGNPITWTLWASDRPIPPDQATLQRYATQARRHAERAQGETLLSYQRRTNPSPAPSPTPVASTPAGSPARVAPPAIGSTPTPPDPSPGPGTGQRFAVNTAETIYLQTNLPYDTATGQVQTSMFANAPTTAWLSICSPVRIESVTDMQIDFTSGAGTRHTMRRFDDAQSASVLRLFERHFGTTCPDVSTLSQADQQGISQHNILSGMSKTGVVLAVGYPPQHRTPDLSADTWWIWRDATTMLQLIFVDGVVGSNE